MWTLLVLCCVIASHGVRGGTTEEMNPKTSASADATYGVMDSAVPGVHCGGNLFDSMGTFASPNFPNPYPLNADCIWYITPSNGTVQLDFPFVNIEYSQSCGYDAIYVYDGPSIHSRLLGKVCGSHNSTTTFFSTGTSLTVRFRSDGSVNLEGFHAYYYARASCRYNCGGHMGNCSCSSSCRYYGNCCHDYTRYCQYTTRPPITARPSCRYNCGGYMGSCSCLSSCQHYGNCCYDYTRYCQATTQRPPITARPSCYNNCGGHMGSCSCTSSCQYYGNCCYDYYTTCLPTTQRPTEASCRYNCGRDLGNCSCSSSCRYFGNCCHDYTRYCQYTTRPPITAGPSCRYNCGRDLGRCSCSSSCQYYGNCCHDYYSYCQYTTQRPPITGSACGGSLFGSGTFSSPNHPNHYYDNAFCVWQLRAAGDQRLFLSFMYLQLENCCDCDYISVYDGPSVNSRYLGKVCNDSLSTFYSSSNYLTVVFRTDGSVVARGFNADFRSTLPPSSGRVDCSSGNMNIVIKKAYLDSLGYDGHSLYLNDPHCRPYISRYEVAFNFPINQCGNTRKFENGRFVYTNSLRAYTSGSGSGEITHQSHLKMNVACRMDPESIAQILYVVHHHENSTITGTGRFNTSMDFYTSSNFYYRVSEVPYMVTLNQYLYVQVDLGMSDSSLVLFLDTCVTSPSPYDFQSRAYYLVRNGCPMDNSYYAYNSGTRDYARFRFRAFQFLRATESVYIQCKVLICQSSDYNSRCRRGCSRRAARDLGAEHDSHTLVMGPIQLKDPEKETPEQDKA